MATLIDTDDVTLWAEEFCRIFKGFMITNEEHEDEALQHSTLLVNEGNMISWFANAMETAKRLYRDRLSVTAQRADNGSISIVGDLPQDVLISSELLMTMIDQHNRNVQIAKRFDDPVDDSGHSDDPDDEAWGDD